MKYLVILFVLVACGPATDKLQESINEVVKKSAHDPASYEAISTVAIDTVYNEAGQPCAYEFIHSCRMKNALGALIKSEFYVQTDATLSVINMTENRKQRYLDPCGYIEKHKK